MKLTIEQQAALGRMGYAIRATVIGLRHHGEEFDLVIRAMMQEVCNLCLTKYHGRSLTSGRAEFAAHAETVWDFIAMNNPELLELEQTQDSKEDGGN